MTDLTFDFTDNTFRLWVDKVKKGLGYTYACPIIIIGLGDLVVMSTKNGLKLTC
jgi:hypothetical protein